MKSALIAIGVVFGLFLAISVVVASPVVGEVVKLHTREPDGGWAATPLWVVDLPEGTYLRAGSPATSGWVMRWHEDPAVRLERGDETRDVRLHAEPDAGARINAEMARRYGWADTFLGVLGDRSHALPLRVEFRDP